MNRRRYMGAMTLGGMACVFPFGSSAALLPAMTAFDAWNQLCIDLLKDWCDGMLRTLVIDPSDPLVHGSLDCPSCDHIPGRCEFCDL